MEGTHEVLLPSEVLPVVMSTSSVERRKQQANRAKHMVNVRGRLDNFFTNGCVMLPVPL